MHVFWSVPRYLNIYITLYVYQCKPICIHIYITACANICKYTCMCVCVCVCWFMFSCKRVFIHRHLFIYFLYTHMCIYPYVYIHIIFSMRYTPRCLQWSVHVSPRGIPGVVPKMGSMHIFGTMDEFWFWGGNLVKWEMHQLVAIHEGTSYSLQTSGCSQDGVPPCANAFFSVPCLLQPWRTKAELWPSSPSNVQLNVSIAQRGAPAVGAD